MIKGYKVFNPDWTCSPNGNTKQYTCPCTFEEDVNPSVCNAGMHFCKVAADCFNYYNFNPDNHVAEVAAYGTVVEKGDKCATNKLEIIREIPWAELLEMVNTGKGCAGLCNSGNRNSGNRNSGNCNSGNCNSGNWNSGNCNSGGWNSGNRNSGDCNSGDWNNTNFSNGCFNTVEPTIHLFNKPSSWTYRDWLDSEARYLMNQIQGDILEWVYLSDMTDEEKAAHPEAETTGGYLKELDNPESAVIWWRLLDQRKKNVIMKIPNFDKAIFKEITGIDVD